MVTLPIAARLKLPIRISAKIQVDVVTSCWRWTAAVDADGYGSCRGLDGKTVQVHRLVYTLLVGEISEGLDLDHACRTRRCCNPGHLRAVPAGLNRSRRPIPAPLPPGQLALFDSGPVAQREPGWRP
jgi:hypothetical protein